LISVVINTFSGGRQLQRCIEALLPQPFGEVIVPVCPSIDPVDDLRRRYPSVRFVLTESEADSTDAADPGMAHLIYCKRRAAGLDAAQGEIVALTEDQVVPDGNWCEAIAAAHRNPYAAIGGAVENAGSGILHEALHLFDFGVYQKPFQPSEVSKLTDQNVSYKRSELEKIRHIWKDLYHESAVHAGLRAAGEKLWLTPESVVRFDRGRLAVGRQLKERFAWGRVFGGERAQRCSPLRRAALVLLSPIVPALIVWTRVRTGRRKGFSAGRLARLLPVLSFMAISWTAGEVVGGLTAEPFPRR
jgi:hypothetical protein